LVKPPPPQLALVAERKIVMLSVPGWVSPQYHVVDVSGEPDGVMTTVCEGDVTEVAILGNPFCPSPAALQVLMAAWIFELIVGSELVTRTRAPVAIVSLCSSTIADAPRGATFLLSPNRLNVAVSRAQALAIVVGCPELMDVRCHSLEEMRLVNLLCHLVHYAEEQAALPSTASRQRSPLPTRDR
jgi:hypothetical protein